MIQWDEKYKQILTSQCIKCPDPYFAPYQSDLLHVGCCSYSPVFTLFEIYKMVKSGQTAFFWDQLFYNPNRTLDPYRITVHAHVADPFYRLDKTGFTPIQEEDLRIQFSVCQFFESDKGCGLTPSFKNHICRSFICSAVEQQLSQVQAQELRDKVSQIQSEVACFNAVHEGILRDKGWDFVDHMEKIILYLSAIE